MIWESGPWKAEVGRLTKRLGRRANQKRWSEASYAKVEQEVFYIAYVIRKLIEAQKISDEVEFQKVTVARFRPKGMLVEMNNWHKLDKLYDLAESVRQTLSLRDLCNQVIHSYIFAIVHNEINTGMCGFFFASDRQKPKGLFYIELAELLNVADNIVRDDIVRSVTRRSGIGQPLEVLVKSQIIGMIDGTKLQ